MKNLDTIIKNNLRSFESSILENKELFTEVNTNSSGKRKYECDNEGRRCYFKFSEFGKVMFVPQYTTLYYFNTYPKTSQVLNLNRPGVGKNEFGYYEEIYVPAYEQKVKRYFPVEDWTGWDFLYDQDIPFAIKTRDKRGEDQVYTLTLVLVDPVSSVVNIENPAKFNNIERGKERIQNLQKSIGYKDKKSELPFGSTRQINTMTNPSRGWIISGAGVYTTQAFDSGTGYYSWDGTKYLAYNITGPEYRFEESSWVGSDTTDLVRLWNSGVGMAIQIVAAIAITVLTRNPLALEWIGGMEIVASSTAALRMRVVLATILAEAVVNVPVAISFFATPGSEYDSAGWISLLFCLLPLVQAGPLRGFISDFSDATCWGLAQKVVERRLGTVTTMEELNLFFKTCTLEEKALAMRVLASEGSEQFLKKLTEKVSDKVLVLWKQNLKELATNEKFIEAFHFISDKFKYNPSFWSSLAVDFGSTFAFGKAMALILEKFGKDAVRKGDSPLFLNEKQKKEQAQKLLNLKKQFELLPKFVQENIDDEGLDENFLKNLFTEDQIYKMITTGVFGEDVLKKLYSASVKVHEIKKCDDLWIKKSDGTYQMVTVDGKEQREFNENVKVDEIVNMMFATYLGSSKYLDKKSKEIIELYKKCLPEGGHGDLVNAFNKNIKDTKPTTPNQIDTEFLWNQIEEEEYLKLSVENTFNERSGKPQVYRVYACTGENSETDFCKNKNVGGKVTYWKQKISHPTDFLTNRTMKPVNGLQPSTTLQTISQPQTLQTTIRN